MPLKRSIDEPQGYIEKLQPLYNELFRTSHAIVGNAELAEYVLKKAIYEAYQRRNEWRERMSFREGLHQTVRMVALSELQNLRDAGSFDTDWEPSQPQQELTAQQRRVYQRLMRENAEMIRALTLYYACGLRVTQIAQVMRQKPQQVRDTLYMFRRRIERSRQAEQGGKHTMEDSMEQLLVMMLQSDGEDVPASGPIFRAFERDAAAAPKPRRSVGRIVAISLCSVGALLCAALFWLVAILMEPSTQPTQLIDPQTQSQQMRPTPAPDMPVV